MNEKIPSLQSSNKKILSEHKKFRYLIFATIYLHQGFIEVFMYIYMALYLLSFGVSILYIGLSIAIGTSPWIIKPLYGILSDRKGMRKWGRRIPYMLVGSFFGAILFFMLIPVNPVTGWIIFLSIITAANFFNALCDTATDGLIVDTTEPEKRGTAQSICWGSKFVGYVTAAILVGFMIEILGWGLYFIFMGLFLLIPIPMLLISREAAYEVPKKFSMEDLKDTFKERLVWIVLVFFFVSGLGLYIVLSMLPLFFSLELKFNLSIVGIVMSLGYISFVVGCIIAGPILDRISRRKSITISIIILSIVTLLVSLTTNILMALIFMVLAGLSWGVFQIVEMTLSMDICKKSIGATMYSLYMSILNLGGTIGSIVGAILVEIYGFRFAFMCAAFIVLSTLILVIFMKGTEHLFQEEKAELLKI
jgi:PAT family beta-lactamase induction signal transducer AmpG